MMKTTNDHRKEYNELLKKEKSQDEFMNSKMFEALTPIGKDKIMDQYRVTANRLNDLLQMIGKYKQEEILGGFTFKDGEISDAVKKAFNINAFEPAPQEMF